jgi:hypothetical protein
MRNAHEFGIRELDPRTGIAIVETHKAAILAALSITDDYADFGSPSFFNGAGASNDAVILTRRSDLAWVSGAASWPTPRSKPISRSRIRRAIW